ncbi:MAG: hypothetical protein KJZ65_00450 [Phycisphaerales bacterium]|nr:hypothetical protein [Phycisphaerales bacterium]
MANVIPSSREAMIAWFADRDNDWAAAPAAIGLTAAQVTQLSALVTAAQNALAAATAARIASKDATLNYHITADALREFGGDLVKVIKAYADLTNNPTVYSTASIPPPAPPTPAGPPVQPTDLAAQLLPGGGLRLTWKGTIAQKAYFSVYRRAEGQTSFTLVDSPAAKSYDDFTIPTGANSVTYYIQARRDDFRVDSPYFQVNFGSGAGTTVTTLSMAA